MVAGGKGRGAQGGEKMWNLGTWFREVADLAGVNGKGAVKKHLVMSVNSNAFPLDIRWGC